MKKIKNYLNEEKTIYEEIITNNIENEIENLQYKEFGYDIEEFIENVINNEEVNLNEIIETQSIEIENLKNNIQKVSENAELSTNRINAILKKLKITI